MIFLSIIGLIAMHYTTKRWDIWLCWPVMMGCPFWHFHTTGRDTMNRENLKYLLVMGFLGSGLTWMIIGSNPHGSTAFALLCGLLGICSYCRILHYEDRKQLKLDGAGYAHEWGKKEYERGFEKGFNEGCFGSGELFEMNKEYFSAKNASMAPIKQRSWKEELGIL